MTAAGKVTAATIFTSLTHPSGEGPVRVLLVMEDAAKLRELGINRAPLLQVATRKTGTEILAAVEAETRLTSGGFHRAHRQYRFRTSAGWTAWMAAAQTMWLAPEDPAGVKRAHVEALAEDLIHPEWTTGQAPDPEATGEPLKVGDVVEVRVFGDWKTSTITHVIGTDRVVASGHGAVWSGHPAMLRRPAPAPEVTAKDALAAIGKCWAGGALTGKALKAWADGDHKLALALAADQQALQAEKESAGDARETAGDRLATVETLGDVAAEVLDLVAEGQTPALAQALVLEVKVPTPAPSRDQLLAYSQGLPVVELAYSSLAAGVQVAPLAGPCQPTAEDLSGLAVALVAEDLETLDPEEVRVPATHRVVPGDVVRIHRGTRLYEVLRVEEDRARNNLTGEVADMTMARVAPCDPEDRREAQWVHVDLLHVVPPVARVQTQMISHDTAISRDVVMVAGAGWDPERGEARRVALIRVDGTRVLAIFRTTVLPAAVRPVGVLRIGDSLVVDGRCYRVVWHGEPGEPILEPARWRDRLPA